MLGKEEYLNIILESPVPCMWVSLEGYENNKTHSMSILGCNNKLLEVSNKQIREIYQYNLDMKKYIKLYATMENTDGNKKITLVDFVEILGAFYQIDVIQIDNNIYVIWFTKKIEIDKNIQILLDKMEMYLWFKDTLGRYIYMNKGLEEYPNATPENMIGKTDFEIFPEELANIFVDDNKKLLNGEKEYIDSVMFYNKRCYDALSHVVKDDKGDIVGTVGTFTDALSDNEYRNDKISDANMLHLISDTIPDSIFFKDCKGMFRHCNKVFAESRNLRKEDIIGKTEKDINTPIKKIKKYENEEKEILLSKKSSISNSSEICSDGRVKYFETIKVPFLDRNQMVGGVLGISRDISHRKEAELEFERLRMEFFANLSHEFKTPLNLIFSSIQLIEYMIDKGESIEKYSTYTKLIKQNGYRILKMVNNLIDSTRLSSGCLDYMPQNYNIFEFIENMCESVQYYANEENIELIFDTNLEEKIMAFDLEKMDRIMLNLLSNAIKYNKENGKIEVSLNFEEEDLYIKVKDSGIGIPKDKLDDVFKLFKQVNNRITKLSEGSGIGLSIVKSLVNLHNGTISAYSEKDEGSEFVIKIPISMCEEKECEKKTFKYNKYVENIDIEFSDIYTSIKV
ncbi:PAS domain-containing sensor histidine kinase [Romboutsia sp.]|uniref:PAS domain-containing sensor histidine kinase n=1 Tax=Romboutsia sp. TaxID=1965302 RepID=UPI002BDFF795|nr:PAS domain-containing sensor histidine kinase [Romboutsia sp.]HSQ88852.1 PAS domain-containing sensor histidine kinase [Romboutsia sp.]